MDFYCVLRTCVGACACTSACRAREEDDGGEKFYVYFDCF